MTSRVISVTFEIEAQHYRDGQFSVPRKVCDLLEIGDDRPEIALVIESESGVLAITTELKSGSEIYGRQIEELVKAGEKIRVTASRPKK